MNTSPKNNIEIRLKGELNEIANLAATIDDFCFVANINDLVKNQVNLVLEELYTNSANYGIVGIPDGQVVINLVVHNNQLEIRYHDNGVAFNPLEIDDPELMLSVDDRPIGGLGVYFVKAMTDEVSYQRVGEWNQLLMHKKL